MERPALPLSGRSVVVTRAEEQASVLRERLVELGATVVELPTIVIEPAGSDLAAGCAGADWIVVTSANAVAQLRVAVPDLSMVAEQSRVAAIGPATAAALTVHGLPVDLMPDLHVAEALVDAFPSGPGRVFLPQAAGARPTIADGLRGKGWQVDVAVAYRTVPAHPEPEQLAAARAADAITFTSSSTVVNFLAVAGLDAVPPAVCCIGPVTAATAAARGVEVTVTAEPHTIDGLVDAVVAALSA